MAQGAHVAISRTFGAEDKTVYPWPMPDLTRPPLHTLPLDQLLAKLRSLTNLRAVKGPDSPTGWKLGISPWETDTVMYRDDVVVCVPILSEGTVLDLSQIRVLAAES